MPAVVHAAAHETIRPTAETSFKRVRGIASFPPSIEQNPYQRLLYESLVASGFALEQDVSFKLGWLAGARRRVSVLHFHWPQGYYRHGGRPLALQAFLSWLRLCLFAVRLTAARFLGYRIVWTIHQVYPHETPSRRLDQAGGRILARFSHVLIAHDGHTADQARSELGVRTVEIVPHGSYIGVYPEGRSREVVRAELGVRDDAFVFLCFGHLRAYKELDLLLEAFRRVSHANAALVVAGMGLDPVVEGTLGDAQSSDSRIRSMVGFVPDERVAELFGACDVAVLPRSDGGTSGSLVLALSLGLPAVAASTPHYRALIDHGAAGWAFEPANVTSLASVLDVAGAYPELVREKGAAARRVAERLRWTEIGERTAALLGRGA